MGLTIIAYLRHAARSARGVRHCSARGEGVEVLTLAGALLRSPHGVEVLMLAGALLRSPRGVEVLTLAVALLTLAAWVWWG